MWENFTHFDPADKESVEGTCEFFDACFKYGLEKGMGPGMERSNALSRGADGRATPKEVRERALAGSPKPAVFRYQRKIREAFNPNNLGDEYYLTLDDKD